MLQSRSAFSPGLQKVLKSHTKRATYWAIFSFLLGALTLYFHESAGKLICMFSTFYGVSTLFDYSRLKKLGVRKCREAIRFEQGLMAGIFLALVFTVAFNSNQFPLDRREWMWFLVALLPHLIIWINLEETRMRQTTALLDEPTG